MSEGSPRSRVVAYRCLLFLRGGEYTLYIMKKYKLGLLAVLFVLGLFIFNTNSAVAVVSGCTSTAGWSATTGESCVPTTTPPTYECKNGFDLKTGFICGCTSTKGYSTTTGQYCGKITTPPEYPPVISGVSGPQYLDVNGTGTWTVKAYDRNGGRLSYGVVWGDEVFTGTAVAGKPSSWPVQQSATFTHSYSQWGTYKPTFTVTNDNGQSAQTSLEVRVGNGETPPDSSITVLSPNGGEYLQYGKQQTISWKDTSLQRKTYDIILYVINGPTYVVAKKVNGFSFTGYLGNMPKNYNDEKNFAPPGTYGIQVCDSSTGICDVSDNYFTITSNSVGSSITVLSPNGGETWVKETIQKIKWSGPFEGAEGEKRDIMLVSSAGEIFTVARDIYGPSYEWVVGSTDTTTTGWVKDGSYKIAVYKSNSIYDSSDSYFKIVKGLPIILPPTPICSSSGYDTNTGFRCGCTSTRGYSSTTGESCGLENFPSGCNSVYGYSTTTGVRCDGNPTSTPTTTCTITSTLRLGSSGADVSCLQSRIGLISDGKFGPRTLIAVKAFQANAGLKADGVVGPKSISALEVAN